MYILAKGDSMQRRKIDHQKKQRQYNHQFAYRMPFHAQTIRLFICFDKRISRVIACKN